MKTIAIQDYNIYADNLNDLSINNCKKIINTINAHSYIVAKSDPKFKDALINSDILLPDGEGIVLMAKKLKGKKINKIAGADIHLKLLELADSNAMKCFYLGASESTLKLIIKNLSKTYKNVDYGFYSPPFKSDFSEVESQTMINEINKFQTDILFVGMTAPKQEKWVFEYKNQIDAKVICSIGAVFDFVAETKKRAPQWVIDTK